MKKYILLTLFFVFLLSFNVYAKDTFQGTGYSDYYIPYDAIKDFAYSQFGCSSNNNVFVETRDGKSISYYECCLLVFPSNSCIFIDLNTGRDDVAHGFTYYDAYVCTGQNSEQFTTSRSNYDYFIWTSYKDGMLEHYTTTPSLTVVQKNGDFCFKDPSGTYIVDVPICTSYEDAEMYMTTGDYMYLWNYEKYIDVPTPKNVSMYEASAEKGVYVYWEHAQSDLIYSNYTVHSNVSVSYLYKDASGNDKSLTVDDIDFTVPNYSEVSKLRNQHFISYEPLLLYDTGFIQIDIWDDVTLENGDIVFGDVITLKYYLSSGEFTKQVFDKDGNSYDDEVITSTISDYGTKNDSFTGGNPIISNIDTGDNSDFSIIGGLTSLFGLLGDNGVIKAMKHTFSFYPDNIYTIIHYGLFATIVISLYNRATK